MFGVTKDRQWVQVKDFEGYAGWIHRDLLGETPAVVAKSDINVRTKPDVSSDVAFISADHMENRYLLNINTYRYEDVINDMYKDSLRRYIKKYDNYK